MWLRRNSSRRVYRSRVQFFIGIAAFILYSLLEVATIANTRHTVENVLLQSGTMIFILLVCGRLICLKVLSRDNGLHVVNMFSSFDLVWREIDRFEVGRWGILPGVCRIYVRDGRVRNAIGISENGYVVMPEGPAGKMVEELNRELAERVGPHVSPSLTEFRH